MKRTKKQLQELSLTNLLQDVQAKITAENIPADQQQNIIHITMNILQICVPTIQPPPQYKTSTKFVVNGTSNAH